MNRKTDSLIAPSGDAPDTWAVISPRDLMNVIQHRLPSVALTAVLTTAAVVGLLVAWPNEYISDGLFYARLGRGAVAIDPTTEPGRSVSLQDSRSSEVASISQMLGSREIADRVVRKVGAREINFERTWVDRATRAIGNAAKRFSFKSDTSGDSIERAEYDRQIAHEAAVKRVVHSVAIEVPKNSYTISVTSKFNDPIVAQKIVQSIMDEYGAYHVEAHNSTGSLGFFEQQTESSQSDAIEARKKLQQAKSQMGWMSTVSAEESLRQRILNLELSLDQTNSELADASSKAKSIAERLETIEEWIPMETTKVANNAVDGMRTQLYGYKLQDGEELSKVTASHPRYKILRDKIIQGEDIVNAAEDDREQTVEARNPLRLSLETDYQTALTTAAGHASRRDSLAKSLESAHADLQRLNDDAVVLAELNWAADIAEKNYLSHSRSLESSRMMQELDNQKMSDVSVIQNASLNLEKVGPPRAILACIGAMLGLCLGMIQALVRGVAAPRRSDRRSTVRPSVPRPKTRSTDANHVSINADLALHDNAAEEIGYVSSVPR
ncbi:hypothetical protein Poly51_19090 [Rubripirellula tenax]|uniref:Chain length determinant protein n=1 Tax=Rubripirellula tenax TaxID=2528015 RepID=A0A5C6FBI1_9BACT|nr:exopolysaccharide biosynthesis protein [Rubripirellula tenax]TWU59123.1 hypothetical protein Poly51_19090 [Rubripirellula tenax]